MRSRFALMLAALAVVVSVFLATRGDDTGRPVRPSSRTPHETPAQEQPLEQGSLPSGRRAAGTQVITPPELAPMPANLVARLPIERPRGRLRVIVVDTAGEPVAGAGIRAHASPGATHDLLIFDDGRGHVARATSRDDGRAELPDLELGAWWLTVEHGEHLTRARVHHEGRSERRIVLDRTRHRARLLVRVVDAGGVGVEGARVELSGGAAPGASLEGAIELSERTGPDGAAVFRDPGLSGFVAVARTQDGRSGSATAWTSQGVGLALRDGVKIVVDRPGSLGGAVRPAGGVELGAAGELVGARVEARLLNNATPYYTTHGGPAITAAVVDRRYRFDALPPGLYTLALVGPHDVRLALPELRYGGPLANSIDPLEVEIRAGEAVELDLEAQLGGAIEGVVRTAADEGARPLGGALVRATFAPRTSNFPDGFSLRGANVWRIDSDSGAFGDHPDTHPMTTT